MIFYFLAMKIITDYQVRNLKLLKTSPSTLLSFYSKISKITIFLVLFSNQPQLKVWTKETFFTCLGMLLGQEDFKDYVLSKTPCEPTSSLTAKSLFKLIHQDTNFNCDWTPTVGSIFMQIVFIEILYTMLIKNW